MKKILITGGTGFIGSNFVRRFVARDDEVNLFVRTSSNLWRIEDVKKKVRLHTVNLENAGEVVKAVREISPAYILHFATYGGRQGSEKDVERTVSANILGTVNLMEACAEIGFECFINTGSSSEYGEKNHPMREDELPEPNNLYGVTKTAATMYGRFLAKKHGFPLVTMRLFSAYGPYEDPTRLMPRVVTACLKNASLDLASSSFVRDFVFIEDIMDAYDAVIARGGDVKGEVFNVGTGEQHSIKDVVDVVKHITGATIEPTYGTSKAVQHEPKMWVADIAKARKLLAWTPRFSFRDGLIADVEWFKKHLVYYQ